MDSGGGRRRALLAATLMALTIAAGAAGSVFAGGASRGGETGSSLKAWGEDANGQVGNGTVSEPIRTPVAVSGVSCAVSAAVSQTDAFAVLQNGTVEAWGADGDNKAGSLGDSGAHEPYSTTPVPVAGVTTAVRVTSDIPDVYVLLANGTIVGWGDDHYGQFGDGEKETESGGSNTPVPIARSLSGVKEVAASAGGAELALLENGEVDSWGNAIGNDTLGREGSHSEPGRVDIEGSTPMTGATAVAEGAVFSLALVGGEVKSWGDVGPPNNDVLGAGPKAVPGIVPVTVGGESPLTGVSAIAAGGDFALALVKGEVKAWGSDYRGQLGDGATSEGSDLPVTVSGLSKIAAIAAIGETGYALDAEGHIWAWGNNEQGELGTGSSEEFADNPVEIESLGAGNTGLADGEDGTHELAVGAPSGSCSSTTTTTTTSSSTSQTSTSQSSTQTSATGSSSTSSSGSTSSNPSTGSRQGSGLASSPAAAAQLLVSCSGRKLALTDVVEQGSRVMLKGAAVSSLAGHKVEILFDSSKQVATATVKPDGLFSASAPLPPAKLRGSNSARYLAESGGLKSLDLKLTRRLILDPPTGSANKVALTGEVTLPLAKPIAEVLVQRQLSCGRTVTVAHFKPNASGRFHLTIPAPPSGKAAIYRLSTKVRGSSNSSTLFSTFSLPEPVSLIT